MYSNADIIPADTADTFENSEALPSFDDLVDDTPQDFFEDEPYQIIDGDNHSEILLPRPGFGRCRFRALLAGADGTGSYHINNHVGFFRAPSGFSLSSEIDRLYRNFPRIFSPNNIATAIKPSCTVNGNITIQFVLNGLPGLIHDDWVSMQKNTGNFVATTLERQFWSRGDHIIDAGSGVIGGIVGVGAGGALARLLSTAFANVTADINRRHFLAGKRSWTLGQLPNGLHFVETAAFERYSHSAFSRSAGILGIRNQILETWTKFVENYVASINAGLIQYRPSGYQSNRNVAYREQQSQSASALRSGWFRSVLSRHPGL